MNDAGHVILVVNHLQAEAENLKELIEFMDRPHVCTATPEAWREVLGDLRLDAVFVGPDVSDDEIDGLLTDIGEFDANVPIVLLQPEAAA